jgi:hypothetical protein
MFNSQQSQSSLFATLGHHAAKLQTMLDNRCQFTLPSSMHLDTKQVLYREPEGGDGVEFRRTILLEDPDALELQPRSVVCRQCQTRVILESPSLYMVESWLEHKGSCNKQTAPVE